MSPLRYSGPAFSEGSEVAYTCSVEGAIVVGVDGERGGSGRTVSTLVGEYASAW
jgi:hypothetical protein